MIVKERKIDWEKEFTRNYPIEKFQEINHFWWRDCYDQIEKFVFKNIPLNNGSELIECGCGSGNSSLKIAHLVKRVVLFDGSAVALSCAKKLADYYGVKNVEFIKGDAFCLPFQDNQFDFCWNIGLIEHYNFKEAGKIVGEMLRVVEGGGHIIIGVPNFTSLPIIKARILGSKILRPLIFWAKGYKIKDEIKYNLMDLKNLIFRTAKESGVEVGGVSYGYVGSVLPIETPRFIFKKLNKLFSKVFPMFSFLILVSIEVKK